MNLDKLKEILNSKHDDSIKEDAILQCLAEDKRVIPALMTMLHYERNSNRTLIKDFNILLSKSEVALNDSKLNKDNFINKEIEEFFFKNKKHKNVGHLFKVRNESR